METLRHGDGFERGVELFIAEVTRHGALVSPFLDDPDLRLRQRALSFLIRSDGIDATALRHFLSDASAQSRRGVWRELRRTRGVADWLIDQVRDDFGEAEAARLLPACGAETVAPLLPEVGHHLRSWTAVGRRHPLVVLAEAERQLADLAGIDRAAWWTRHGDGVFAAAETRPIEVLDLLERLAPSTTLPGDLRSYGVLAAADPARVLALLTAPARAAWLGRTRLPPAVLNRLGRLDPPVLADLARGLRDHAAPAPSSRPERSSVGTRRSSAGRPSWCGRT